MQARFLFAFLIASAQAEQENPLGKVIQLLDELSAKVTADGEREAKAYSEYVNWCGDVSANTANDITTLKSEKARLEATIDDLSSKIETGTSEIEELANSIAQGEGELNDATVIRTKEVSEFKASQSELVDAIDTLDRAVAILQREMSKNPAAALAQIDSSSMASVLQSLTAVVDAASFNSVDKKKLLTLVQSRQDAADDDAAPGAPAGNVYESHSTSIFDLLSDLREKATGELSDLRKAETNTAHNFGMLKQSLTDQIAADNKDKDAEASAKSAAEEAKANAEGDHAATVKDLKSAEQKLAKAQSDCTEVASDHETSVAGRNEELATIAQAKKILVDTSSGAVAQTYSFLQLSSRVDLAGSEVVALVKKLAREHHSATLAQLASRITAVMRYGSASQDDVFAKVKSLISDLIAKLESEASADATEKAYCDEMMAKTEFKRDELNDDIAKLTSKIDVASAKSVQLKDEVKALQAALAKLAKETADMNKIRSDQNAAYVTAKADLELGLSGVRQALELLRDYYGGDASMLQQPARPELFNKAGGAGSSILGILEVCESDFAKNLAKEESAESDAQSAYDELTQENNIDRTEKEQSVKYKTENFVGLDKAVSDLSSDRTTANTELDAVMEYYGSLKSRCIAKPETYEERKRRRTSEIEGLKQALAILEDETAFVQRKQHNMQGTLRA